MTTIPPELRSPLDRFAQRLREELHERLISVILYGGVARGEYVPGLSDVNLLVVVKSIELGVLDRIAVSLEEARRELPVTLLTLTESDLADSAEVFPTKFLDIQRRHQVLWGADAAAGLKVPRDRLRRQCARELTNLQLRLRQAYLDKRHRPELLEAAVRRATSSLFVNLAVLVELKTGQPVPTPEAAMDASPECGLDPAVLRQCLRLKRSEWKPGPGELKEMFGALLRQVGRAVECALPPDSSA